MESARSKRRDQIMRKIFQSSCPTRRRRVTKFAILNLLRDIWIRRPICLFGENGGATANNNSWYFWSEADFLRPEFGSYFILNGGKSAARHSTSGGSGFVIKRNSLTHWLAYAYSSLHVVTLGFRDTVPASLHTRSVAQRSRHPVIHLGHGVLGIKMSNYDCNSYGGNLFRRCAYSDFDDYAFKEVNGLLPRQVWRWPALPRHVKLAKLRAGSCGDGNGHARTLWFITWRDYLADDDSHASFADRLSSDIELLVRNGLKLTVVLHHHFAPAAVAELKRRHPGVVNAAHEYDVLGALATFETIVTDFSSIALEAFSVGKQVVLYASDVDTYLAYRSTYAAEEQLRSSILECPEDLLAVLLDKTGTLSRCDRFLSSVSPVIDWDEIAGGQFVRDKHDELAAIFDRAVSFVGYDFTGRGGTVSATHNLAEALADEGLLVNLVSIRGRRKLRRLPGIHHRGIIGDWPRLSRMNAMRTLNYLSPRNPFAADRSITAVRPSRLMSPLAFGLAMRMAPARILVSTRETLHAPLIRAASTRAGQKVVLVYHTQIESLREEFPLVLPALDHLAQGDPDLSVTFATVTLSNAEQLRQAFPAMERHEICILGNTLPRRYFIELANVSQDVRHSSVDESGPVEAQCVGHVQSGRPLCVAILTRMASGRKVGLERVVELADRCRERGVAVDIRVYGSGSESSWFGSLSQVRSNLTYMGAVPDSFEAISSADLIFEPHSDHSFGMVILEALVLQVPVLAWMSPGASEILGRESALICDTIDAVIDRIVGYSDVVEWSRDRSGFVREYYSHTAVAARFLNCVGAGGADFTSCVTREQD